MTTTVFLAVSHCGQVIYSFLVIYGMKVVCHPFAEVELHQRYFPMWSLMCHWSCHYLVTVV
jgi:hypothetical protein